VSHKQITVVSTYPEDLQTALDRLRA
jgi:hypothetical protein